MSEAKREVDVLVVGAGPTGLTLAGELLRHGASVRVVDQLAAPVVYSKAAAVHARTMEVFDAMGVVEDVLARARIIHGLNIYDGGKRVVHVDLDRSIDSPYPHAYGVSQHDTEEVLTANLVRRGGAIERGVTLESFTQDEAGVRAAVTGPGGVREEIRARWLVGCDGAHSAVRKGLGFSFEGAPYEERLIQTDARVDFGGRAEEDEIIVHLHERGPAAFFPLFQDGRMRVILIDAGVPGAPSPEGPPAEPSMEDFHRGLALRGVPAKVSDPAWTVAFRIHHRHVERLREGRVFIAGDAAHIHSPVGGQGMNTGIQDAFNLAWKLGLAARHAGRAALLDSYEPERLPVIRALVSSTDRAMQALEGAIKLRHPLAVGLRDQLMGLVTRLGVVQAQAGARISMLEVGYADSPACAQDRPSAWQANVIPREGSEAPNLLDWAAFGGGPGPGARGPDATARGPAGPVRVHELLRGGRHVALLFDGAAATEAGYANLTGIARRLRSRFGDRIEPHLVVPATTVPAAARWEGSTLLDEGGEVHQRYGARSECVYVLRPDGHVGYRGQPADGAKLEAWLDRLLEATG